jgi:putative ABC transport system permease protein
MREWLSLLPDLWQDVRYAVRTLRRSPGFTLTVIITLGLGTGANATMLGLIDQLMFRPYPYLRDPSTVHRVYWQARQRGSLTTLSNSEYRRYLDLAESTTAFAAHAGFTNRVMAVGTGDAARERMVGAVSASFFEFFDARPTLGRFFTGAEDATPRGADVAVLGYGFWQSELGGRNVLGEPLQVGNIHATIIGVAPEGFVGTSTDAPPAVYIPITTFAGSRIDRRDATTYFTAYYWRWMEIMVRRRPNVTVAEASRDASRAAVTSWNARRAIEPDLPPAEVARPRAIVSALKLGAGPDPSIEARTALWVAGVAGIVLLIACANVANLLLARALKRQRETAVRLALGVSRRRLIIHSLAESLVLAAAGTLAGLTLAAWGSPLVRRLLDGGAAFSADASFSGIADPRTLAIATAIGVLVVAITGLTPALLSGRGDLTTLLRAGARAGTRYHSRARTLLLVTQGALSVVLLIGAGLFLRSLRNVEAMPLGYDAERVLVASSNLRGQRLGDSARVALRRALLETAQNTPGVEQASWAMTLPFAITNSTGLFVPGVDSVERLGFFTYQAATADYFQVMGTRILRGRGLTADDRAGSQRVVVVGNEMARTLWPDADALGKCIRVRLDTLPCSVVVGVAEDIVQDDLTARQRLHYYVPLDQFEPGGGSTLLLRMRGDVASQRESVRSALQRVMPGSAYVTVSALSETVDGARRSWRLGATMFGAFGLLALIVAAVGLYGVIAYNVTHRMHEMGVRIALGARTANIVRLVVGEGLMFAAAGVVIGAAVAVIAARWLQPLLFQQSARDPVIYALVGGIIAVVTVVASASPAVRATRADPNTALRSD